MSARSSHERIRDMWVLEKLVEKDIAAQDGVDDPAVFLGQGGADAEVEVVGEAVAKGIGADAFEAQMDAQATEIQEAEHDPDDINSLLFGSFTGLGAEPDRSVEGRA